jgi:hypothetical protein
VRKGTLITVIVLFLILVAAAIYQLTLGSNGGELQGPSTPNELPTLSPSTSGP